jgi:ABC-type transport system involved in multi-copper enzyme maturation permease subunit
MRFVALLRKELRESLPWLLLAGLLLLGVGLLTLRTSVQFSEGRYWQYNQGMSPGETVNTWRLLRRPWLQMPAMWLAFIAPGLGLVLGVRHFWMPLFTRTWSFLLHRSVPRLTVLWAKLAAAIVAFLVSVGLVWTGLYWYACRPDLFPVPESRQMLLYGWICIVMGLVVYLGTALSALSTARWYTTRIFGLAFAALVVFVALFQWHPAWIAGLMVLAVLILLSQTTAAFLSREF